MVDEIDPPPADDGVERHEHGLIAKAKDLARDRPGERFVAIVAEAGAPEVKLLRTNPSGGLFHEPGGSIAAFLTRDEAKQYLGKITPQLLDWLEDEGNGTRRKLPVIHAARRGMRTTAIEYDLFD